MLNLKLQLLRVKMSGREPKRDKYEEYYRKMEENAGPIHRATKPVGRPKPNVDKVPFEHWDWQREDPDFYASYMRLPDSKDPESLKQVKWNRYHQSLPAGDAHMKDFRPRTFIRRMKWEILVFSSSILIGIFGI